ncbi:hypothetical protein [Hahella sp. NBU794]|uniref:hypothetical protein n=1 Tax=Hahella sp. NBU794 TaxID=3422590 RepID=UPI003D6DE16C
MSELSIYEQALVAVLNEAKLLGIDMDRLSENVNAGIMGNKPYTWIDTMHKQDVLDVLENAVRKLESHHAET